MVKVTVADAVPLDGATRVPLRYFQSVTTLSGSPTRPSPTQSVALPGPSAMVAVTVVPASADVGDTPMFGTLGASMVTSVTSSDAAARGDSAVGAAANRMRRTGRRVASGWSLLANAR